MISSKKKVKTASSTAPSATAEKFGFFTEEITKNGPTHAVLATPMSSSGSWKGRVVVGAGDRKSLKRAMENVSPSEAFAAGYRSLHLRRISFLGGKHARLLAILSRSRVRNTIAFFTA